jgi:hypothetical protein
MLPLRCLEGRTPRFTHCRTRRSPKTTKLTPARLVPLCSAPALTPFNPDSSSPAAVHQRPSSSPSRSPPTPADTAALSPTLARSMEQEQDPLASGEIHRGGTARLQGSRRLSSTLVRRPLSVQRPSFLHPSDHGAPPPSSTIAAEPSPVLVAVVLVRRRSPLAPTPMAGIDRPRLPLSYAANVYFRCFSHFKGTLQLFLMDVVKVNRGCCTCYICCKCFRSMLQVFVQNVLFCRRMLPSFFI